MNATDLPTSSEGDIEKLKQELTSFCKEKQISKFDAEDIIELLQDGESVDWLIDQLKSDAPDLDDAATSELLTKIQTIVGPEDTAEDEASADEVLSVDEEALEELSRAQSLSPDDPVINEHLGDVKYRLGYIDEVLPLYLKAWELGPEDYQIDMLKKKIEYLKGGKSIDDLI